MSAPYSILPCLDCGIAKTNPIESDRCMGPVENVLDFVKTGNVIAQTNVFYCETRDQANARISNWVRFFQSLNIPFQDSIILGAILGELTNNSFDHNLGQWDKVPGCVVGFQLDDKKETLRLAIGDRGQGIVSSLRNTVGQRESPDEILKRAFNERISGRAPEKRGNGLKFVRKHIAQHNAYLFCRTQGYEICFGMPRSSFSTADLPSENSTFIYIEWSLM